MFFHGFPTVDEWENLINISDNVVVPGYGDGGREGKQAVEVCVWPCVGVCVCDARVCLECSSGGTQA